MNAALSLNNIGHAWFISVWREREREREREKEGERERSRTYVYVHLQSGPNWQVCL